MKRAIVVGSGIAGLIAALELSRERDVTLVTKAQLAESNTRWAQGGIAVAMFEDDSVAEHVADTLRAGAGLCNVKAVEVLCAEGPQRIRDLMALGVEFDRKNGELARGMEAAHSHARVLHAGGDATGLSIEMALVLAVRKANVRLMEHTFACDLVMDGERVCGLDVMLEDGTHERLEADDVVLASGGAGQMYLHTTNPSVATGDGVAIALRAGAQVADAEFYQFHPTALALPGSFLISEAVRGDGAVLLDANGRRFMQAVHPGAELAPRDVVARGIARQMAAQGGAPVLLDATVIEKARGEGFLRDRFPTIDKACRERGLDWAKEPIPVTPAAHYWMGGVKTDVWGRTSIEGLYAVGECACTGVHGANRLASNSLLESLVFAWRAAGAIVDGVADAPAWPAMDEVAVHDLPEAVEGATTETVERMQLRTLMWKLVGIERSGEGLMEARAQLARWRVAGEDVEARETANLLALARVMVEGALARHESRGAHYREDYPEIEAAFAHSLVYAQRVPVGAL
jgi:L-aspartate oxidase